jgi:UDP-GlcNAc:undecaprenyl-phosphate/decaprenyl-phosphate GlcNAc-1-phosphate transferase
MPLAFPFLITFIAGLGATLALTPLAIWLGRRYRIEAVPGGRRKHTGRISKLGAVPVFVGFVFAVVVAQTLPVARFDPKEVIRLIGLLGGGAVIFVVGLLDDMFELSPLQQGIGQILAAGVAVFFQIFIETVNNPLTGVRTEPWPYFITITLSMAWLGITMNTVNFLDGLDGLAAGVAFIASVMLFIHGAYVLQPAQISVSLLPLALCGVTLGYLFFNFYPARIFLGGGAPLLGFFLGALSIIGGAKMATILMVLGLPLMDFAWQVLRRIRQGRNPMTGDRGHLHFRLYDTGYDQRLIVSAYYLFCAFFGVLTLTIASAAFKFAAMGVMVTLLIGGFAIVARRESSTSLPQQP